MCWLQGRGGTGHGHVCRKLPNQILGPGELASLCTWLHLRPRSERVRGRLGSRKSARLEMRGYLGERWARARYFWPPFPSLHNYTFFLFLGEVSPPGGGEQLGCFEMEVEAGHTLLGNPHSRLELHAHPVS